ncbi:MAG: ABC transporter ATP-binding protein [Gammaproteobacteria bacterium]|nr:ABC transporter ATP-binding protein [Gammaproteobacteria bacterium]
MNTIIKAKGVTKLYGGFAALNNVDLDIPAGRIVGLIGPNGAGKSTLLRCMMGMTNHHGELSVMSMKPAESRRQLMQKVAYIADTAVLPKWIRVAQLLEYAEGVHPNFDRKRAESFLAKTQIKLKSKVSTLSKGMTTQVHLAIAISIDAKLLVLDEPTLGLDILYRKQFYEQLLNDFFDEQRTIIITTHQVEEVEALLSDVVFIQQGKIVLDMSMEELSERFYQVEVSNDRISEASKLNPIYRTKTLGGERIIIEGSHNSDLPSIGTVTTPSIADLFMAKMA